MRTIREYFQVLKDTLFGVLVEPYRKTRPRKSVATSKFYLFDVGVGNTLAGRTKVLRGSEAFGRCLEHFVFTELRSWIEYTEDRRPLTFWRSRSGDEVDFLLGDETALEVKASRAVTERHLRGLSRLSEEVTLKRRIVVSLDPHPRRVENVLILPVEDFLGALWSGEV